MIPLSFAQRRLWFLYRFEGPSATYNIPLVLRLSGVVNVSALVAAIGDVVARHASLRTIFVESDGIPYQRVLPVSEAACPVPVLAVDSADLQKVVDDQVSYCFELSTEIPVRASVLRCGDDEQVLVLVVHHIAADGASMVPLAQDLAMAYAARRRGEAPGWPELPVQYVDYTLWQLELLGDESDPGSVLASQLDYWRGELAGLPELTVLPIDRQRPRVASHRGGLVEFLVGGETRVSVEGLARREGVTVSMVLQAGLAVLLYRLGAGEDIAIGSPIAGRTDEALADLVGFFVNTWVLRTAVGPDDTFTQVLARVKEKALAAYSNQDAPFELLVELLNPARSPAHHPLFQVALVFQNNKFPALMFPGVDVEWIPVSTGASRFDLFLNFFDIPGVTGAGEAGYEGLIEYATDLFDRRTVELLARRYTRLLHQLAVAPDTCVGDVDVLEADERRRILRDWNATDAVVPVGVTLVELIEEQVRRAPEDIALVADAEQLTYTTLDARAEAIARTLRARGVGPDRVVAVALPRSVQLIVALVGVLKAGGVYLPIDITYPKERLAFVLRDAGPAVIVADSGTAPVLPDTGTPCVLLDGAEADDADNAPGQVRTLHEDNLAYLIYTSGSTGTPKGVAVTHRNVVNLVGVAGSVLGSGRRRVLASTSTAFDVSVLEIFGTLCAGGVVELVRDVLAIAERGHWHGDVVSTVPSAFGGVLERPDTEITADTIVFIGEPLTAATIERTRAAVPGIRVVNGYGPTEATVYFTEFSIPAEAEIPTAIPIGRPIGNCRAYVLDARLRPVPTGVTGELYLAGVQVARGYHRRPELTASRFVADPFDPSGAGGRLYRTGDVARWTSDGLLEYGGRVDEQVKIRGFRVEPGEVQAVLAAHPAVRQAAVAARELSDASAGKQLIGYVVVDSAASTTGGEDELVGQWRRVYDDLYSNDTSDVVFGDDFGIWKSSYTGLPIPIEHMREWRDAAVERLRELRPKRVLELGVGTGLLLSRLAVDCDEYWASDFSAATIAQLEAGLRESAAEYADRVRTSVRSADDLAGLPEAYFDAVVLNSVVQYFPGQTYLRRVVEGALRLLAPGGVLFVGDVRNRDLLEEFTTGTVLAGQASEDVAKIKDLVRRGMLAEQELLLAPEYFLALADELGGIAAVDIELKRGLSVNEMSKYRYDVALHKGPAPVLTLTDIDAIEFIGYDALAALLPQRRGGAVRVTNIPHIGLIDEVLAVDRLRAGRFPVEEHGLVGGEVRLGHVGQRPSGVGLLPEDLHILGELSGFATAVTWSARRGRMEAVFVHPSLAEGHRPSGLYRPSSRLDEASRYANNPQAALLVADMRRLLAERLPDYMVPAAIVVIDELPLTPNGKLNRAALPDPAFVSGARYRAARTDRERVLTELFADVLGIDRVGIDDGFFELGGHSLLATRLVSRIRAALGVEVPIRTVFEAPTPRELAPRLDDGLAVRPALVARRRPDRVPLSYAQRRLWFLHRLAGASATYNIPLAVRLTGALDSAALAAAVGDVVGRHESLRTVFVESAGTPEQLVLDSARVSVTVPVIDVSAGEVPAAAAEAAQCEFELATEIPIQARILRAGPDQSVLMLVVHHIAADGWSLAPLLRDLVTAYTARSRGEDPQWTPLPAQYVDYTLWQAELLGPVSNPTSLLAEQVSYWRHELAGLPEQLALPTDRTRPRVASHRGGLVEFLVGGETRVSVEGLARREGVTVSMVLQAGLAVLLYRLGAGEDIAIGSPIAGRTDEALADLVGVFVNTWVLRTSLRAGASFADVLAQVKTKALAAYSNQDVPFELLVELLNPPRSTARHPFFQVALTFENNTLPVTDFAGLRAEWLPVSTRTARFDLFFGILDAPVADGTAGAGWSGFVEYSTDLFDRETVELMAARFVELLRQAALRPRLSVDALDVLVGVERAELLALGKGPVTPEPGFDFVEQVANQARTAPREPAVIAPDAELDRGALDQAADLLARQLADLGVGVETVVALIIPRSVWYVVAVLATWRTGAAYAPIDPAHPVDRIMGMIADSGARCVVTVREWARTHSVELPTFVIDEPGTAPSPQATALPQMSALPKQRLAYVIFTSGSTGRPKPTAVHAEGFANTLGWYQRELGDIGDGAMFIASSPSFDTTQKNIWVALLTGRPILLADPHFDPARIVRQLATHRVAVTWISTRAFGALVEADTAAVLARLDAVVLGGEPISIENLAGFDGGGPRFANGYGPTETADVAAFHWLDADRERYRRQPVPLGTPIANTRLHVLGADLRPVPRGVVGELYIAGPGVGRGYAGYPALTAQRFVADPYGHAGDRMYRTGDLARWRTDRTIEYQGRVDDQIKLHGIRVEPGEIEAALLRRRQVAAAAVTVREHRPGDQRLVGYVVQARDATLDVHRLRRALARELPAQLMPAALVAVDRIPLTPNGKLDRAALPAPDFESEAAYRAPRTRHEETVADLFAEVLGVQRVGIDDGFFALGGHSLLATRLVSRIRAVLGVEVPIRTVFEAPTVAELIERLDSAAVVRPVLAPMPRPDRIPLSFAQRRLWFWSRFEGASATYNVPLVLGLSGPVDADALVAAVRDLVVRHESLRTVFVEEDGVPFQRVLPATEAVCEVAVLAVDAADVPAVVDDQVSYCFDLAAEIPVRCTILRCGDDEWLLVLLVHHIAADGASMAPLARDLATAYRARSRRREPKWTPLPVQYVDYTLWQAELLGSESDPASVLAQQVSHWRQELAGLPEQLALPTDRPRPRTASHRGDVVDFSVDPGLYAAIDDLALRKGATAAMVLQSALAVLLHRIGCGDDIPIGSPIAGRLDDSLADVVGFFVNTWVLRVDLSDNPSFDALLSQVKAKTLLAYDNQDAPFERLVELLNPERSTSYHALFQVMLAWQNNVWPELDTLGSGITVTPHFDSTGTAKFDLLFNLIEDPAGDGVLGSIEYATDLFDHGSVELLAARFLRVLTRMVENPALQVGVIDVLDAAEHSRLMTEFNGAAVARTIDAVPKLVAHQANRTPDAVAVECAGRRLSYAELESASDRLAHWLTGRGAGPETLVGVAVSRTVDLVVVLLGVLKSGAGYVPIDPGYPTDRIAFMVADADPVLILTDAESIDRLPAVDVATVRIVDAELPDSAGGDRVPLRAENLAYVMYTSGSTGVPKGVAVSHGCVVNGVLGMVDVLGMRADSRMLAGTSVNFDVSVIEIFTALSVGACVEIVRDVLVLGERDSWTGGVISGVPTVFAKTLEHAAGRVTADAFVFGGDRLAWSLVRRIGEVWPDARIVNPYGQCESFYATAYAPGGSASDFAATGDGGVPIGGPIANMRAYVLGAGLMPVPVGVVGELYVGGAIARGYRGRAGLTAARFVADPFGRPGSRMYRTGDLVRWRFDGALEYLGRVDDQVKLRGFRIEPAEIEAALAAYPGVAQAAAVVQPGRDGMGAQLVGYVVPSGSGERGVDLGLDVRELRRFVAGRLPEYMVPSSVMVLDQLPLGTTGKLDRRALPAPEFAGGRYEPPRTATEHLLAELFAEILGLDRVGVLDDFFSIGGDSIRSIQVVARARERMLKLTPRQIFEYRTVAELAATLDAGTDDRRPVLEELDGGGVGSIPLPPMAHWLVASGDRFGRFSMTEVLELPSGVDAAELIATLDAVLDHHDALRARLETDVLSVPPPGAVSAADLLHRVPCPEPWDPAVATAELNAAAGRLDPAAGIMAQFVWFEAGAEAAGRLAIVLHHLVVDGVSLRILLSDLAAAWRQVHAGEAVALPPVGTSLRRWAHGMVDVATSAGRVAELELWRSIVTTPDPLLGVRPLNPSVDVYSSLEMLQVQLPESATAAVLTAVPRVFRCGIDDGLLAALALAVARWRDRRGCAASSLVVRLEGHGREEDVLPGADLSRTVGWFTSMYPVPIDMAGCDVDDAFAGGVAAGSAVKAVKEQLLSVPDRGIGFGVLRYLNPETAAVLREGSTGQIGFNYLGRYSSADLPKEARASGWARAADTIDAGPELDAEMPLMSTVEIGVVAVDTASGPRLHATFGFAGQVISRDDVQELADLWCAALTAIAKHAGAATAGGLTPSDVPLVALTQHDVDELERRYRTVTDIWPLPPMQSGLLFHTMLAGSGFDAYHLQLILHLEGQVDPARMRAAGRRLLERHSNLRVAFADTASGEQVQVVLDRVELPWQEIDLSRMPDAAYEGFLIEDQQAHFDSAVAPLLRLALVHRGHGRSDLLLTAHHALFDGWSIPLLLRDLFRLYRDDDSVTGESAGDYRDFLVWLSRQDAATAARAWAAELDGVEDPTLLAGPQSAAATGDGFAQIDVELPGAVARAVGRVAAELGVTMNTLVQGAWAVLLNRLTGRDDVLFGATVSGRPPAVAGVDSMVGLFINTLPVRVRLTPGQSFAELLADLQRRQAALLDHHHHGLAEIQRATGIATLFDTLVVFESYPIDRIGLLEAGVADDVAVVGFRPVSGNHYPLTVLAFGDPHLQLALQYQRTVFDADAAAQLAARFARVLEQVVRDPWIRAGVIDVLEVAEHVQLADRNSTAAPVGVATVPELVARQAVRTPDAMAVVCADQVMTYAELHVSSDRLARSLRERGAGPETLVGVAVSRSIDLVAVLLGVLKSGAAYMPIDPGYPADRIQFMVADADPVLILADGDSAGRLCSVGVPIVRVDAEDSEVYARHVDVDPLPLRAENLAYVMYTSGSTGVPKGVAVTHGCVVNSVFAMMGAVGMDQGSRTLAGTSINFDISVFEFFATLSVGGCVDVVRDVLALGELDAWPGGVVYTVPTVFAETLDQVSADVEVETFVFGGDRLTRSLVRRIGEIWPAARVVSTYGQTESFHATVLPGVEGGTGSGGVPIGRPIANMHTYVLASGLVPAPVGAIGELYVGGSIARGYHGRAELTASRFVADPFGLPGARMYRTGDLARWNADGVLVYLGRADDQVKLRGIRIELAEVETALLACPGVAQAAAVVRGDQAGSGTHLLGYVVPAARPEAGSPNTEIQQANSALDPRELRRLVAERLPEHMVPASITVLDRLPLGATGKLDRRALPVPEFLGARYVAPRTAVERTLTELFAEALGADRVGIHDDFFAIGGHSLRAIRLLSRLHARLGVRLPLRAIFQSPTVADLADRLATGSDSVFGADPYAVVLPIREDGAAAPLWWIHPAFGFSWPYMGFADHVHDRPMYGIQARGCKELAGRPESLAEMVDDYVEQILSIQPGGTFHLAGYSFGGTLAHAVAVELEKRGYDVGVIGILDSAPSTYYADKADLRKETVEDELTRIVSGSENWSEFTSMVGRAAELVVENVELLKRFAPSPLRGDAVLFTATEEPRASFAEHWRPLVGGEVRECEVAVTHGDMLTPSAIEVIGALLDRELRRVEDR
ncbi:amino acid adenylation domain-containing protein [Nocardia sp. NPDC050793]|uniref:amino acid adenylation domain-containing protein n=1 Tax=Nocardia sp. NPDC050793 TaxID=3155159 RepID=UPI0033FBA214